MARSLNLVQLIGNLTRDPELRYTGQGTAVVTMGLATNRTWTTESGEKKEDVEYHTLVAWNKLAELCSQLLAKGRKIYVSGRLSTRSWTSQDGQQRSRTEIVIDDMMILDSKRDQAGAGEEMHQKVEEKRVEAPVKKQEVPGEPVSQPSAQSEDVNLDDIPF